MINVKLIEVINADTTSSKPFKLKIFGEIWRKLHDGLS